MAAVFSGGAGGARAHPEFGGSQKERSLISAYQSLATYYYEQPWIWKAKYGSAYVLQRFTKNILKYSNLS